MVDVLRTIVTFSEALSCISLVSSQGHCRLRPRSCLPQSGHDTTRTPALNSTANDQPGVKNSVQQQDVDAKTTISASGSLYQLFGGIRRNHILLPPKQNEKCSNGAGGRNIRIYANMSSTVKIDQRAQASYK
jgi:hypothetical protein